MIFWWFLNEFHPNKPLKTINNSQNPLKTIKNSCRSSGSAREHLGARTKTADQDREPGLCLPRPRTGTGAFNPFNPFNPFKPFKLLSLFNKNDDNNDDTILLLLLLLILIHSNFYLQFRGVIIPLGGWFWEWFLDDFWMSFSRFFGEVLDLWVIFWVIFGWLSSKQTIKTFKKYWKPFKTIKHYW